VFALGPLKLGLLVCAFLYVLASVEGRVLKRRKAKWEYFCSMLRADDLK
jgi:hypothetical protein